MINPFQFRELPLNAPFCDRVEELAVLSSHGRNNTNVVVFSPRRYGKTSLIKRVQAGLGQSDGITVYIDFFGVSSIEDVAGRMAAKLYSFCREDESLLKKASKFLSMWRIVLRPEPEFGISVSVEPTAKRQGEKILDETLSGIGKFIKDVDHTFNITIDEFQEIVDLKDSRTIEGIMRNHIQTHTNASYFFVGSRRRLLKDIFNEEKRAFYHSAINFELKPLPESDAADFIVSRFKEAGKSCPREIAERIAKKVRCYPYYIQRIPYSIFEVCGSEVTDEDYSNGFSSAIGEERIVYESMLNVLTPKQIILLSALALQATDQPFASEYMSHFSLGSIGGIQAAMKRLLELDYVEETDGVYQVVDPVFSIWLRHLK